MSGHFEQFNLKMGKEKKVSFGDQLGSSLGVDGDVDKLSDGEIPTDETEKDKAQDGSYQIVEEPKKKRQKIEPVPKKAAPYNANALQQKRVLEQALKELNANGGVALHQLIQHGVKSVHLTAGF